MSMLVARMQKMKSGNLGGIERHNQRTFENHSNPDIDPEKQDLNYDLVNDEPINYKEKIQEIIDTQRESQRAIRKDAVLVNEWILTSNQEFFEGMSEQETRKFFQDTLEYFSEKFGTQNMAYAQVHLDETTPHMHLGVVPMTEGKLSGKTVFNRQTLKEIQSDLPEFLKGKGFNIERGIEGSERKNLSVATYKKVVNEAKAEAEKEISQIKVHKKPLVDLEGVKKRSKEKGVMNKRVEISPEDFDKLLLTAKENVKLRHVARKKIKENENLDQKFDILRNEYLVAVHKRQAANDKLENKNAELLNEVKNLNQELRTEIDKRLIYADVLMNDFGIVELGRNESKARLVLNKLDRGLVPSDLEQGQEWQKTLEKARGSNIKPDRLERAISKVKEFIEKFKEKVLARRKNKKQDRGR